MKPKFDQLIAEDRGGTGGKWKTEARPMEIGFHGGRHEVTPLELLVDEIIRKKDEQDKQQAR